MTINTHVSSFAGLPVMNFVPDDPLPDDPGAVAWRLSVSGRGRGASDFAGLVRGWLDRVPADAVRALVVGGWDSPYDSPPPIDLLVSLAPRLPRLRALFLGEMTFEECEVSWINHEDITPLLTAYPALEVLRVRGGEGLRLDPVRHAALRELAFESGGLPAHVVRAVSRCELPELALLELWLGAWDYGGNASAADLAPILDGGRWPKLRHLALCNTEIADEVAAAVATAPVVPGLESLDLSKGTLTDTGAEALLAGQPLTHLRRLDLHHNYLTEKTADRLVAELAGVEVDVSDRQEDRTGREGYEDYPRYTAVAE